MKQIVLVSNPLEDRSCAGCVFTDLAETDEIDICHYAGLDKLCAQGGGDYIFVEVGE